MNSGLPLLGGYAAKWCPARVQWDVLQPCDPLEPTPFLQRLFDGAKRFEAKIVAHLRELHPDACVIESHGVECEEETLNAMEAGCVLILGGRLPPDLDGRRVGRPDLLVAGSGGGYRAVDVKNHQTLNPRQGAIGCHSTSLDDLTWELAGEDGPARRHAEGLMQFAHYQRMLEALEQAEPGARIAGIVGTEEAVVWFDLDALVFDYKRESVMSVYATEFGLRLAIIDRAAEHQADPSVPLLAEAIRSSECELCPWKDWCRSILEEGPGDLSLIPRMIAKVRAKLIENGITRPGGAGCARCPRRLEDTGSPDRPGARRPRGRDLLPAARHRHRPGPAR